MEDKIFNNDVLHMQSLIGKTISICTLDNQVHEGVVYVIDPVSKTVVLAQPQADNNLEFVFHHAIKSVQILPTEVKSEFIPVSSPIANSDTGTGSHMPQKLRLLKWLRHMFIDVKDHKDFLQVEDHLRIEPPYGRNYCFCDNTIVLGKIQNIIDLMPENFG